MSRVREESRSRSVIVAMAVSSALVLCVFSAQARPIAPPYPPRQPKTQCDAYRAQRGYRVFEPVYGVRVEFRHQGPVGTASWTESYPRIKLCVLSERGTNGLTVITYKTQETGPRGGLPKVLPGTFVARVNFTGGHGYPPGRCEWTAHDHIPSGLEVYASVDSDYGIFSILAYPLFKSRAQIESRCGRWILGATSIKATIDGTAQDPGATAEIGTGSYTRGNAVAPFLGGLNVERFASQSTNGQLGFPVSRLYAGKSFTSTYPWSTGTWSGSVRLVFTRRR